ncbi:MAG: polysaccharide deacetylase family protein [Peptococcaceae bacterium]|nr:polysaccharide deacetylase family protein [Peptococcaceae bacterium]MDH7524128.1 polysaccharide deacetylase family protein [Peptococcaceae bacterium]
MIKKREGGITISIVYFSKRHAAGFLLAATILLAVCCFFHVPIMDTAGEVVSVLVAGTNKLHPIYAVDLQEKKAAFSFDATWGSSRTPQILQVLAKHNLKTTFFLTNIWLNSYPELAKEIVVQGHETGLHTASHPSLPGLNDEKIRRELVENRQKIIEVTGEKPFLFRPPFGAYNNRVITIAREENLVPVQWSVDSLDWKNLSAEAIIQRVTQRIHPGAIVLFHNDGTNTPQALEPIIEYLKSDGYSIIPISELIYKDNYYIDVNGIQKLKVN